MRELFALLVEEHNMRVGLKSVMDFNGEVSVMISGIHWIPVWCASNSNTH